MTIPLKVLQGIECDFSGPHRAAIRGRLRQRRQDRMAVAPVLGSRRAHLRRNFMDSRSDHAGLVSQRPLLLAEGDFARCLCGGAKRTNSRSGRCTNSSTCRARQSRVCIPAGAGSWKSRWRLLEQGALQPRLRRAMRPGQESEYSLLNPPDGPFYFAGEHLSQHRPLAGGRDSIGLACRQHDRQAEAGTTGVRGQPTVYFGGHGPA